MSAIGSFIYNVFVRVITGKTRKTRASLNNTMCSTSREKKREKERQTEKKDFNYNPCPSQTCTVVTLS